MAAASAAQSAASVVQAGTKDITSMVTEGGIDHKVNETVNVLTAKTTEIGHMTWGIMKGVVALATQKVDELTKDSQNWPRIDGETNDYKSHESRGCSSNKQLNNVSSGSWDDWDNKDSYINDGSARGVAESHLEEGWTAWDDAKDDDDDYGSFSQHSAGSKNASHSENWENSWTGGGGGFHRG